MKAEREIEILPSPCPNHFPYRIYEEDRCVEQGTLASPGDPVLQPQADAYVQYGDRKSNGRYIIKHEVRLTARSRPSTNAYRSGWDSTFGKSAN